MQCWGCTKTQKQNELDQEIEREREHQLSMYIKKGFNKAERNEGKQNSNKKTNLGQQRKY